MIPNITKTSVLVPYQLPEFIRDDPNYSTFVSFLQAYYQWMEQQGNSIHETKSLPAYTDIDTTLDSFIQNYMDEFMTFFPQNSVANPRLLLKTIKQAYDAKGTPASYQFLFRVLYNSQTQLYNTSDYILKASDGKWLVTRYLTVNSTDPTWYQAIGYTLFGETSKGYATIENVIIYPTYIEIVLTSIQQNFISGEYVTVVDTHFNPVLFNNQKLASQIFGVLDSVTVNPAYYGEGYAVGDPIVFYGGLNPTVTNPVGANGYISSVSGASVISMTPTYEGQGYRPGGYTTININSNTGTGAFAVASTFDTANPYPLYLISSDVIGNKANVILTSSNYGFAALTNANINTKLVNALSFPTINTYGIASVTVTSGGLGYDATTTATASGTYQTENLPNGSFELQPLYSLGILAPIQVINGGANYNVQDTIVFSGGLGHGVQANITSINVTTGAIQTISYVANTHGAIWPIGGTGYTKEYLPTVSVISSNGSGAVLNIPGIVGQDAQFSIKESPSGQVLQITVDNKGKDYISTPGVSLRVQDLLVTNVNQLNSPKKGDIIYQGSYVSPTFSANVDSLFIYSANTANNFYSSYKLRTYNYNGLLDANSYIRIARGGTDIHANILVNQVTTDIFTSGRKIYGNGAARAYANFLNGVTTGKGIFQNADGQPSGYSVLQNKEYNNYTYILQVEAALSQYKETALKFLHPSGTNYFTVNLLPDSQQFNISISEEQLRLQTLYYLIGNTSFTASQSTPNSNTIVFGYTGGANIANVVMANSAIVYNTIYGSKFMSYVTGATSNTITMADNWITGVPNVAIVSTTSNSNNININSITKAWSIATGNSVNSISDMIHVYDSISLDGTNYYTVVGVHQPDGSTPTIPANTIIVNTTISTAQTGLYLSLSKNTSSSNIYVNGLTVMQQVIQLITENGNVITTEDGITLLIG
jgi:hypothetical protein